MTTAAQDAPGRCVTTAQGLDLQPSLEGQRPMGKHRADGRHSSRTAAGANETSASPQSGHGGQHSTDRHPGDGRRTDAATLLGHNYQPNSGKDGGAT